MCIDKDTEMFIEDLGFDCIEDFIGFINVNKDTQVPNTIRLLINKYANENTEHIACIGLGITR